MNQRGFSTLEVMIGASVLVIAVLAASTGVSFYQSMNSATSRRGDASDFIRIRLAAMKGTILAAGGLLPYVQALESAQGLFNPVLTVNLNSAPIFQAQFGFAQTETTVLHNISYSVVFNITGFKFNALTTPVAIVYGTDHLTDLAFLTATADLTPLTPLSQMPGGVDAPAARHGEIYIGK